LPVGFGQFNPQKNLREFHFFLLHQFNFHLAGFISNASAVDDKLVAAW
jgi:hypothetical protein